MTRLHLLLLSVICMKFVTLGINGHTVIVYPEEQPIFVKVGDNFTMVCRLSNGVNLGIQWYQESQAIYSHDDISIIKRNPDLTIKDYNKYENGEHVLYSNLTKTSAKRRDGGMYECRQKGTASGMGYATTVIVIDISIIPDNVTVAMGNSITFKCKVSGDGHINPSKIRWYFIGTNNNKQLLKRGITYDKDQVSSKLKIMHTNKKTAGKYICKVPVTNIKFLGKSTYLYSSAAIGSFKLWIVIFSLGIYSYVTILTERPL